MASLGQTFDGNNLPDAPNFEPIPAGWYTATIASAELKDTKRGDGQYISVSYSIVGPEYQGRMVFDNINIRNPNNTAQEIGLSNLNSLRIALGLNSISDTDQLVSGYLSIKVSISKGTDEYEPRNEVKGWKAAEGKALKNDAPKKPAFLN